MPLDGRSVQLLVKIIDCKMVPLISTRVSKQFWYFSLFKMGTTCSIRTNL